MLFVELHCQQKEKEEEDDGDEKKTVDKYCFKNVIFFQFLVEKKIVSKAKLNNNLTTSEKATDFSNCM